MIVRIEQAFSIVPDKEERVVVEDFYLDSLNKMNNVLYNKHSKRFSDVNGEVELMSINIKEGYAKEKFGKKL